MLFLCVCPRFFYFYFLINVTEVFSDTLQKLMQTYQLNSIYLPSMVWHQPSVACGGRDCAAAQPLHHGELPFPTCLSLAQGEEVRRQSRDTGLEAALFY